MFKNYIIAPTKTAKQISTTSSSRPSIATIKVSNDIRSRQNILDQLNGSAGLMEPKLNNINGPSISSRNASTINPQAIPKNILGSLDNFESPSNKKTHGLKNTSIDTEGWTLAQKEQQDLKSDLKLKRLQEEADLKMLKIKLSALTASRDIRIQNHWNQRSLKKLESENNTLIQKKKTVDSETAKLTEINDKLKRELSEQNAIRESLVKAQAEQLRLEEEYAENVKKQKILEAKNKKLKAEMKLKKQEEERKRKEAERLAMEKEKAAKEAEEKKRLASQKNAKKPFTSQKEVDQEFSANKEKIADIKANIVLPVTETAANKRVLMNFKRKIRSRLGQLTNSRSQLLAILDDLSAAFHEAKGVSHEIYLWALNFCSKNILDQAEAEVSVSLDRANPLGLLCCYLLCEFPELKELLIARFIKKCPFIIGYTCSLGTPEGMKDMGWRKGEDPGQYSERMAGITATWAIITISQPLKNTYVHPYPIQHTWKFISRMLNTPVGRLTDGHFAVVGGWWDVASKVFAEAFGKQGIKVLETICIQWPALVQDKKFGAARRLELIGEQFNQNRSSVLKSVPPLAA